MSATTTRNNLLPNDITWIHELAKNELNPEAANIFNQMNQFDPKQLIEESTIQLLEDLRDLFSDYCRVFNSYSENNSKYTEAKIYGITNTPADFMLFRNNVKLVFSNTAHGIVGIAFNQHQRADLSVDGSNNTGKSSSRDLIAQLGPFNDVTWTFQGEKVSAERLVKFYFIEFVKASRIEKKDSSNQLLLKQIKALLQEKGIDL